AESDLEKARAEGNPLAARLLTIAKETSEEKRKQELASLQTEIAAEKAKGNHLGVVSEDRKIVKDIVGL
ncbi:MAG: hypothetical protein HYZ54_02025, partial [Ignavibacteriae bacterium]|nr:hypothetical protein [Ignavibacteriota bacterium]